MVVASRCFAFRALITRARILKSFGVQKQERITRARLRVQDFATDKNSLFISGYANTGNVFYCLNSKWLQINKGRQNSWFATACQGGHVG